MNKRFHLIIILLLSISQYQYFCQETADLNTNDRVTIYSISTNIDYTNYQQQGSVQGGTWLFIKAIGLDQTASNNEVKIADYPCFVPEKGVNQNFITCETVPAVNPLQQANLPIRIFVRNKRVSLCAPGISCTFSYTEDVTPILSLVTPQASTPKSFINWYAIYRIYNTADIKKMNIGDSLCHRFEQDSFTVLNDDTALDYNAWNFVPCQVAEDMTGGLYNLTLRTRAGYPRQYNYAWQLSADTKTQYQFAVIPKITSLSSNTGSLAGQDIQIGGIGFSEFATNNVVTAGGLPCQVTEASKTSIKCKVAPGATPAPGSQVESFIQGSGFQFEKYTLTGSGISTSEQIRAKLLANPGFLQNILQEKGVLLSLEVSSVPEYTGYYVKGFFKAPRTGKYRIFAAADDSIDVYLSTQENSLDRSFMTRVAYNCYWNLYRNYDHGKDACDKGVSDPVDLEAGKYYYMEIFAVNWGSQGYFTVSVEAPNPDANNPYLISSPEVQQFNMSYTPDYEKYSIKVWNVSTPFKLQMYYRNPVTRVVQWDRSTPEYSWKDWTAQRLRDQLDYAANYYYTAVEAFDLDNNGARVQSNETEINGREWVVTFQRYREGIMNMAPQIYQNVLPNSKFSITKTQNPSPPISGTYRLFYNLTTPIKVIVGSVWTADIPYDTDGSRIVQGLRKALGVYEWDYNQWGSQYDGIKFYLYYRGLKGDQPPLTVDFSGLSGGKAGTNPIIEITEIRNGSANIFHEPIPYDMLFIINQERPQIKVATNGLIGSCEATNCSYTSAADFTPILTAFEHTAEGIQLSLTNPPSSTSIQITNTNLRINYAETICVSIDTTDLQRVKCTIQKQLSNFIYVAGQNQVPSVHLNGIGYAQTGNAVVPITLPLQVSSITPNTGSIQGGIPITLTGIGFPSNSKGLDIKVGQSSATKIVNTQFDQIIFVLPPILPAEASSENSPLNVKVEYKQVSDSLTQFTYTRNGIPTLTSISPTSASPVLKTDLIIVGTGFGTDKTKLSVFLDDQSTGEQVYELGITSASDTQINAVLGGGHVGSFTVRVVLAGKGYSIPSSQNAALFKYEIRVSSVTPHVGSLLGGTELTIVGENFSGVNKNDNNVFISFDEIQNHVNIMCTVTSATTTQIKCLTGPASADVAPGTKMKVIVQGRLIEDATCDLDNVCFFTYTEDDTPSIVKPSSDQYSNGVVYYIQGTKFTAGVVNILFTHESLSNPLVVNTAVINDTTTQYTFPTLPTLDTQSDLPAYYTAIVQVLNKGYAGIFNANVQTNVASISPLEGSKGGVEQLTITGSGFNEKLGLSISGCLITNVQANQILCRLNPFTSLNAFKINVVQAGTSYTCATASSCTFTPTTAKTPVATSRTPSAGTAINTPSAFNIVITGSNFNTFSGSAVSAYLQLIQSNSNIRFQASGVTFQTSNTQLNVAFSSVAAGIYQLFVNIAGSGYVSFSSTVEQTFEVSLGSLSIATPVSTSFAGGASLTLVSSNGGGFNTQDLKANHITVCGYGCTVTSATNSQLTCTTPPIRTRFLSEQLKTALLNKEYMNANEGSNSPTKKNNNAKKMQQMTISASNGNQPIELTEFDMFGNKYSQVGNAVDNYATTYYDTSPSDPQCFFGFDFGESFKAEIKKITYQPRIDLKNNVYKEFKGTKFQGSNDNSTWTDIFVMDTKISKNSDYWLPADTQPVVQYRFFRFYHDGSQNPAIGNKGLCQWSEVHLYGFYNYKEEIQTLSSDIVCNATFELFGISQAPITQAVTYTNSKTPLITSVSPKFGYLLGGTVVTITGAGFGTVAAQANVILSGVACAITTISNTQIVCTSGNGEGSITEANVGSIKVLITGQSAAVQNDIFFLYGVRWTGADSWGGEVAPREGDSLYVSPEQTLIVDQSTPILKAVIVEGTIIWADDKDMTFDAEFIIVRGGRLIIGTEEAPYQHKLTITMHGEYGGQQLPEFGNKVIGCHHCTLDIHGSPKTPTWTELSATATIGTTSITLTQSVNWVVGDTIVIASTDFDHNQAETRVITQISNSGKTLSFNEPLANVHYSNTESYTRWDGAPVTVPIRAEVGVLTRNVVIRGDPDSPKTMYGAHLMIHGHSDHGSIGRIEQAEFYWSGQPRILGRYAIHFHMNGECSQSYVRGNAVHDSFARVVTIHAVSYLRVQNNVGFRATGHNIFLEDGIETNNVIENNLLISSLQASFMLQTDITVASIWITNPLNIVRGNRCAGSDFYGMWYEIREHPEGPSATDDICQQGFPLGEYTDNQAHSNVRFGLRIFVISSRAKPCEKFRNDALVDPWSENPSVQQLYINFLTYKNMECGVLAEHMGNAIFRNFTILDSFRAGFQAHRTNFTREEVILEESIIVGRSQGGNQANLQFHLNSKAIILPRTDGFAARRIALHNFGAGMILVEGGSENFQVKLWVQGAKQFGNLSEIAQTNCQEAKIVKWQGGNKANIILDYDGTLTKTGKKTYLTSYKNYFENVTECVHNSTVYYDDSVICTGIELRGYLFRNLVPFDNFKSIYMKTFNLNNNGGMEINTQGVAEKQFEWNSIWKIKNPQQDAAYSFAVVYPTNYTLNVHFKEGVDWQHMLIVPSYYADQNDWTTVLRFNFTEPRELFEIKKLLTNKVVADYPQKSDIALFIDPVTRKPNNTGCGFGDYFVDQTKKHLYMCINGKNHLTPFDSIDMNAIYCRDTCPTAGFQCTKETIVRFWNNDSQWEEWPLIRPKGSLATAPYQKGVPGPNDDVLIPCAWTVKLNQAEITVNSITIDGTVRFDEGLPLTKINANYIWVRGGKMAAGLDSNPFPGKIEIQLTGGFETSSFVVIDDFSRPGNKVLAVTGTLELYGKPPTTKWTRLTQKASAGASVIQVAAAIDWAVGDEIVIGPTDTLQSESEKRKIVAITDTSITLDKPLTYKHYGASTPTVGAGGALINIASNFGGGLDMRATVGHITRSIKIYGSGLDNWGGHIFVYHWIDDKKDPPINARGVIVLDGVELFNMGKRDLEKGGIFFFQTNTAGLTSIVKNSAIHDTDGQSMHAEYAHHVLIDNNVFYNAMKYHLFSEFHSDWTVSNNLFINIRRRSLQEDITGNPDITASLYMITPYDADKDSMKVFGNIVQGSGQIGFVIADVPCSQKDKTAFYDNEAGVCEEVGFIIEHQQDKSGRSCAGRLSAYHSQKCVMFNANTNIGSTLDKVRVAECDIGITQRLGTDSARLIDGQLNDVWIGSTIKSDCPECYSSGSYCNGTNGFQMQTATHSVKIMQTGPLGYDNICVPQWLHSTQFLNNVEFYNFKNEYPAPFDNTLCGDNRAFVTQGIASDQTAGHYLRNVKCTQCEKNALFRFKNPDDKWRGWFGGCGEMDCTGPKNVLAVDFDGLFLGRRGAAFSNNQWIGPQLSSICTVNYYWNGYDCSSSEFGVVEWESIAWDRQRQMAAPVFVSNSLFTNKINAWREWSWQGSEPLNARFMRFVSLVQLNNVYNVTYQGTNPFAQIHKIQHRALPSGETAKWVIYQQIFPVPMSVQVLVNEQIIKPFIKEDNITLNSSQTYLKCGANNYFFRERFVEYVITADTACIVEIRLINSVQISTRLAMTVEDFFDNDSRTKFVDRIASFLQISTDRLKIVGIRKATARLLNEQEDNRVLQSEQVDIDFVIESDKAIASPTEGYNPQDQYLQLKQIGEQVQQGLKSQLINVGAPVVKADIQVQVAKDTTGNSASIFTDADLKDSSINQANSDDSNQTVIIVCAVVFGILGLMIIAALVYYIVKKNQVVVKKINDYDQINHKDFEKQTPKPQTVLEDPTQQDIGNNKENNQQIPPDTKDEHLVSQSPLKRDPSMKAPQFEEYAQIQESPLTIKKK